ncbi:hypothetical protein Pmar_PMAR016137 [Perkinsus marinus ATCC 50983]|uniref:EF-hand domain-containing protein n=1 Tax=Perkinsus marinus (strain ATCC 50983 / TXsc) TaxID=423536 RepID=C5LZ50_PERM5|nr:hypothetical protein Pmar_PMAR016137 [Perkinsus marinus ATCC 50983]EEQ98059.1 hypothetical protein Pmar_PMAR016137 [Perkinsus marinus ATCC 50983]|eukprot:XP_002765342.1 hypothetical protein Pmar_PMAR016137 [Perkinsus marinus ATCC 50983]
MSITESTSSVPPPGRGSRRTSLEGIIIETRQTLRWLGSTIQAVDNRRVRIVYLCASATGISGVCLIASIYSFAQVEVPVPPNPKQLVDANPDLVFIPPEVEYVSDPWSIFAAIVYGLVALAAGVMLLRRFNMLFKTLLKTSTVSKALRRSSAYRTRLSGGNNIRPMNEPEESVKEPNALTKAAKTLVMTSDKFEISGEWFWYRHVASETLEVTMQLLQLVSFGGSTWSDSEGATGVVKPPGTIMAQACLLAFNITFAPMVYFYQNRLIALGGDVLSDIGYVLVQLSAISSVQNPRSWHVLRAKNFMALLTSVFPFGQSLHDIHSMWDYLMLSASGRASCNERNRSFSICRMAIAWVLSLSLSIALISFTAYQEYGWDCDAEVVNYSKDCHIQVHPLLAFPSCDCRMVHLTPDENCSIPIVDRIQSYTRIEYFSSAPREWLQTCDFTFGQTELNALEIYGDSLTSVMLPNADGVTQIDLRGLANLQVLSVTFDEVSFISPAFIRDSPKLRFLSFEVNKIESLPSNIRQLQHLEELVLNINPICSNATALEEFTSVPIVCTDSTGTNSTERCAVRADGSDDPGELLIIRACQQLASTGYTAECKPQCPPVVSIVKLVDLDGDGVLSYSETMSASVLFGFDTTMNEEEMACAINRCPAVISPTYDGVGYPVTDVAFFALVSSSVENS